MDKKSDRTTLFISVLLHVLLVFFPRKETPLPPTVSSAPTASISVVELPTSPELESQPLPAVPPNPPAPAVQANPPAATVDPPADLPPEDSTPEMNDSPIDEPVPETGPDENLRPEDSIPETNDGPIDEPVPKTIPDEDLPPEDPSTETSDSPIDEPASEVTPDEDLPPEDPNAETSNSSIEEAKIAADWENLVGYLEGQDEGFGFTLLEIFDNFGETGQANQFFDENRQPKLDVSSFFHFPGQTPDQVLQTVVRPKLINNTGFALQSQENVAGKLTYQLSQGEMLRYMIIVRLREGEGSVLMLSNSLLGLES
ncbi:MAG: hypothetical protein AAGD25_35550 [Cyanobacteria bacterium P01_F01_bin.150]